MVQKEFNLRALMVRDEHGVYRPATGHEIIEAAQWELKTRFARGAALDGPERTKETLQLRLACREHEVFAILWLDLCAAEAYVQWFRLSGLFLDPGLRPLNINKRSMVDSLNPFGSTPCLHAVTSIRRSATTGIRNRLSPTGSATSPIGSVHPGTAKQ